MRYLRVFLLSQILFLTVSAWAQSSRIPNADQAKFPERTLDPQAVSVINQVITTTGGDSLIKTVKDYVAAGNVTYHHGENDVPGTVTVSGRGLSQSRMDTVLAGGRQSLSTTKGKSFQLAPDGTVKLSDTISLLNPSSNALPYSLLSVALRSGYLNVFYKGLFEIEGHSVHEIRIQPNMPRDVDPKGEMGALKAVDFFVDASTFQVLMTQDMIRTIRNMHTGHPHEVRYSDYRPVDGLQVPFSIKETVGGQKTWDISLTQISFNQGLVDLSFELKN